MRISRLIVALIFTLAACGGGGDDNVTDFDESPAVVEVTIAAGNITVTGNADTPGASVETVVDGDVTSTVDLTDGVLSITDDCDADCSSDYSVLLATDADLMLSTMSGNVTVNTIAGTITVDSPAGVVTLATVEGDLQIVVGEGSVLGTRLMSSTATFEAVEGDIDVTFDEVVSTLVVATEKGDVTVQLPDGDYTFETDPEDRTELRIDESAGASNMISLTTGDGEIIVYRR